MIAFFTRRLMIMLLASAACSTGTAQAASRTEEICTALWETAAACTNEEPCNEDTVMFLPSASRSAVIAGERLGFSFKAFEGYCLQACRSKTFDVDEETFSREVCKKNK